MRNSIKRILDEWDPIDLLNIAPNDECDCEITQVLEYITNNLIDCDTLAFQIHKIYSEAFGNVFNKSVDECKVIAKTIIEELV